MGRILLPSKSHQRQRPEFKCRILTLVHPVLFHIGAVLIPSYGALAAVGVLLALVLALRTARMAGPESRSGLEPVHRGAVCRVARLSGCCWSLLNWSALRLHPQWLLGAGHDSSSSAGWLWARWRALLPRVAYALAATAARGPQPMPWPRRWRWGWPLSSWAPCWPGPATERETTCALGCHLHHPLAARWSGTPLGVPLHPVQAYAAMAFLTLSSAAAGLAAASAVSRAMWRGLAAGHRRDNLRHRVLARSRRPRLAAGRRARWTPGGGGAVGPCWWIRAAGTKRAGRGCGLPRFRKKSERMGHGRFERVAGRRQTSAKNEAANV